jgi:hypothetical protein
MMIQRVHPERMPVLDLANSGHRSTHCSCSARHNCKHPLVEIRKRVVGPRSYPVSGNRTNPTGT